MEAPGGQDDASLVTLWPQHLRQRPAQCGLGRHGAERAGHTGPWYRHIGARGNVSRELMKDRRGHGDTPAVTGTAGRRGQRGGQGPRGSRGLSGKGGGHRAPSKGPEC